jgi:hypothetical protein
MLAREVSRLLLTVDARVQSLGNPCGICSGRSVAEAGFSSLFSCKLSFHRFSTPIYHQGLTYAFAVLAKSDVIRRHYSADYAATRSEVSEAELRKCYE